MTDPKKKIVELICKAADHDDSRIQPAIGVTGNGNNIAGRDQYINHKTVRKVVVTPGDGAIDAAQAAELRRLIDAWMEAHNAVKKSRCLMVGRGLPSITLFVSVVSESCQCNALARRGRD
ncbi:MAG: hypothetical protein AUJ55_11720 [Proteobacteria bacterium CG1_02_64_396]|nr:MAG: hypothetical protein AUJ55_11720 [Proteobacteria bacterium CG1_02_64_396]